jgi:uncharacterized glyoxalase superfamily protein PhnB
VNHTFKGSTIIPALYYRDAHAAIDWLCRAFGFEKQALYEDEHGHVVHAQLTYGAGMLMLSDVKQNELAKYFVHPDDIQGRETQSVSVTVTDCKAHYEHAKAAGAKIIAEYEEKEYGGAGYGCRDLEDHIWWFGSYDPWHTP